jgi:hypothetical protein
MSLSFEEKSRKEDEPYHGGRPVDQDAVHGTGALEFHEATNLVRQPVYAAVDQPVNEHLEGHAPVLRDGERHADALVSDMVQDTQMLMEKGESQ